MPSNDERRQVAARLREEEYGLEYFTLMAILGFDRDVEPYFDGYHRCPERLNEDMRLRLAELIEPEPKRTCHNIESGGFFRCSNCGCEIALHLRLRRGTYHALYGGEANFCPNCGARVKEEE